ncbi:hypothetical protein N7519_000369 [Penicillium mononematosum]|uniref:uncharacterized protein n=1 Tax=Penicillium mononematosum TaxID=268346 RepID=UPI002549354C|nr:uncharacterized protein N7519_000369 [Penicillium mononematosum]KAJ6190348.1 hypothetical protein N7519_000369 [Penicillium mononematosum]
MGVSGSTLSGRPLRMQAQRVDPSDGLMTEGPLRDAFGEYTIVTEKFNKPYRKKRDWYCKHEYAQYGSNDSYHYVHLDGRYYSQNPDGSKEHINLILKQASYTPPGNKSPIDCADEVDWEELNEIPDLCIARAVVTHKHMEKFMQDMKTQEKTTIYKDIAKKRRECAKLLKEKESPGVTEDEAEETDCETEEWSDEEEPTEERNENQQTTDEGEVRTPQGRMMQRMTPMPEEQLSRTMTMTPMSDLTSDNESIDESLHPGETEGRSSQKRKANEMEDSEDETPRTPAPKRGNMDRRDGTGLTVAEREERKRMANRKKRARAKAKRARVRCETEERTFDP